MNKETINALLERAEEMLDKNYSRKIGAEEIITILREYERLQKENEELKHLNMGENIPKEKVIKVLEEIKDQNRRYRYIGNRARNGAYDICIRKIEELLEEN